MFRCYLSNGSFQTFKFWLFRVPDFDMAFDLCSAAERPDLTARVHLLKGQFLEDQGQFQAAENEFIAAGKTK